MCRERSRIEIPRQRGIALLTFFVAVLTTLLSGRCVCGQTTVLVLTPGRAATVAAGSGKHGYAGDGRAAALAALANPSSVAYSESGDLYIADTGNHILRRVTADGTISTVAGNGVQGFSGDGGPASQASLDSPQGIAIAPDGTLYIADTHNQRVRQVTVGGTITTIAGSGHAGFSGDGGEATAAQLRNPVAIAAGLAGELYIADSGNHRVRRLARDGTLSTVAGNGVESATGDGGPAVQAGLDTPTSVAVRPDGALLIADRRNNRIRVVAANGIISSLPISGSPVRRATGVAAGSDGMVYVADTGQHQVRQVASTGSGVVLGSGTEGSFTAGAPAETDTGTPMAVAPDGSGGLAIADSRNGQVYHLTLPRLSFIDTPLGSESTPARIQLQNPGNNDLKVASVALPPGYVMGESSTCGAAPLTIPASASCTLAVAFHPIATGTSSGLLTIAVENGLPQQVVLIGTAIPSATALSASIVLQTGAAVTYTGAPLQFTASVVTQFAAAPSGVVTYLDGGREIGSATLNNSGTAQFSTSSLAVGIHSITARYGGDAHYSASTSPALQQTVVAIPDFTLTAAAATLSMARGGNATATFTLQPVNGTLGHSITLQVNGLPPGTSVNISPSPATLASDPVRVDIVLKAPATLASLQKLVPFAAGGLLLLRLRRLQATLTIFLLCVLQGCGGGYLNGNGSASSSPRIYTVTVTATTTGVLGDPLIHTAAFTLVVN